MKKNKAFEIHDRIDLILRSTLRAFVFANRVNEPMNDSILDAVIASMNTEDEWKAFKESFRSAVQNEAEETLAELKTKTAKMRDELEREKKQWEELIEKVTQEKNEWVASSETFKEIESLLDLIDRVFADESECASHRLECKKAIFNRAVSKLYENEHA